MTKTIARLILAMLLLPATGAVFLLMAFAVTRKGGPPASRDLLVLWAVVYGFIACYWILLWRSVVRWTARRLAWTFVISLLSLGGGAAFGTLCFAVNVHVPPQFPILLGGGFVPVVWVLATVVLWTETPRERLERLTALGAAAIACPFCGYSLAGLSEARCPECGHRFTLEELLAVQPRQHSAEPL